MPLHFFKGEARRKSSQCEKRLAPDEGATLLVWAVWIYWRHVPAAPTASRRIAYAIAFVGVLLAAGYAALWAAWMLATLLFGA